MSNAAICLLYKVLLHIVNILIFSFLMSSFSHFQEGSGLRQDRKIETHDGKGLIRYEEGGRAKLFYPLVKREHVAVRQTREFLQRIYHGSVGIMMNTLAKQDGLTEKDLRELEEFLEQCHKEKDET